MRLFKNAAILFICVAVTGTAAYGHASKAWQERINIRTATIWVEGQELEGLVLNARGELNVTWLERNLVRSLERDRDVHEWVVSSLSYYSSTRKDNREKLKGRDVFVLNYRAVKYWNFDPTQLFIGGYAITSDDILTKKEYWESGELSPGYIGSVAVAAPSPKAGQAVEIRYEGASSTLEIPRK